jgi:hypothetical protein
MVHTASFHFSGSDVLDAENFTDQTGGDKTGGNAAATVRQAGIYSSQDQPSF